MTQTVLIAKSTADLHRLQLSLPGVEFIETANFDCLPDGAHRAALLALRSGVRLGGRQLDQLPLLQHVVRVGSGTDNIDVAELARRGITLHRNPHVSAAAVAEWCLVAALSLARRIPLGHNALLQGRHMKGSCLGSPLSELDVAVWGAGPVGRSTARLFSPFARQVTFAHWPSNPPELQQLPAHTLIEQADVHVVALPLRDETRGLFNEGFLAGVAGRQPLVVCAGRIETLDVEAFIRALDAQRIGGLALDAIEAEHVDLVHPATGARNLLVTPHIGAQRADVRRELDAWLTQLIASLFAPAVAVPAGAAHQEGQ